MSDGGSLLDIATKGINTEMHAMSGGFFGGEGEEEVEMTNQEALNEAGEIADEVDEIQTGGAVPPGFDMTDVYNKLGITSLGESLGVYDILKNKTSEFTNIADIQNIDDNEINTLFTALYFHSAEFKKLINVSHKELIADTILLPIEGATLEQQRLHINKLLNAIGGELTTKFNNEFGSKDSTYNEALSYISNYIINNPPNKFGIGGIKYVNVADKYNKDKSTAITYEGVRRIIESKQEAEAEAPVEEVAAEQVVEEATTGRENGLPEEEQIQQAPTRENGGNDEVVLGGRRKQVSRRRKLARN